LREQKICWIDERNDIVRFNHAQMVRKCLKIWLQNVIITCIGILLIMGTGRLALWLLSGIGPVMYIR